jgi:hypothetical protein
MKRELNDLIAQRDHEREQRTALRTAKRTKQGKRDHEAGDLEKTLLEKKIKELTV